MKFTSASVASYGRLGVAWSACLLLPAIADSRGEQAQPHSRVPDERFVTFRITEQATGIPSGCDKSLELYVVSGDGLVVRECYLVGGTGAHTDEVLSISGAEALAALMRARIQDWPRGIGAHRRASPVAVVLKSRQEAVFLPPEADRLVPTGMSADARCSAEAYLAGAVYVWSLSQ